jgi:hypothetical protein
MRAFILIALGVLLTLARSAAARQIESWPYDRLFKEADVVVIASAQETIATEDRATDDRWKDSLVGQNTTLTVQAVLKGDVAAGPLTVLHFKVKEGVAMANGPLLVAFRTKGPTIEGGGSNKYVAKLGTPQYLLFLKAAHDGRFEPVSGQIDPISSVKEIYQPLPSVIDRR